jgi:ABC-type molybdate transport system substrate-binding protein
MRWFILWVSMMVAPAMAQEPLRLHAAGSLRAALTDVLDAHRAAHGIGTNAVFGASGLLRERLAGGEASDVFASANMQHPAALAEARRLPVVLFSRNRLCGLARPGLTVTTETLLDRMLDPSVRLATSTPRADPSGDYAFESFARAEALRPGARTALEAKALLLVGGPNSPRPPEGRNAYAWLLDGQADLVLTYCTNATAAAAELRGATIVALPEALAVGADYGMVVLSDRPEAARLALFILSPAGQGILGRHGFEAPTRPMESRP